MPLGNSSRRSLGMPSPFASSNFAQEMLRRFRKPCRFVMRIDNLPIGRKMSLTFFPQRAHKQCSPPARP